MDWLGMEPGHDYENIGWGLGALVGIIAAIGAFFRSIVTRSRPDPKCPEMRAFKEEMKKDMTKLEESLKRALEHSDMIHEGIKLDIGELKTSVAVAHTEIKNLKNGKR